jgi:CBS domain-containing protein
MANIERHVTNALVALDALTPCREAAKVMRDKKIGSVAVSEGGRVVGIVTERDLVSRVLAAGDNGAMPIGEAMRTDLPNVGPTTSEAETAELMRTHYTRHLLVEERGRVVGIISMRDVIQLMLDDKQFLIEQLQTYIDGC